MSRVGGKDTRIEMILRRLLWKEGFRYRKNKRIGKVRVDLAFLGKRLAVFVDGCFWHGCPKHYTVPDSNTAYWKQKMKENRERDKRQTDELEKTDWTVLRFWGHSIEKAPYTVVRQIKKHLTE